jgi:cytochrome c oxidase subunit 4
VNESDPQAQDHVPGSRRRERPTTAGVSTYLLVYAALLVLLVLTVAVAKVNLGEVNLLLALAIAVAKTVLVLVYFMHLRFDVPVTRLFACAGFLWLLILLAGTLQDVVSRSDIVAPFSARGGSPSGASGAEP